MAFLDFLISTLVTPNRCAILGSATEDHSVIRSLRRKQSLGVCLYGAKPYAVEATIDFVIHCQRGRFWRNTRHHYAFSRFVKTFSVAGCRCAEYTHYPYCDDYRGQHICLSSYRPTTKDAGDGNSTVVDYSDARDHSHLYIHTLTIYATGNSTSAGESRSNEPRQRNSRTPTVREEALF